jgi:hypothetical protein
MKSRFGRKQIGVGTFAGTVTIQLQAIIFVWVPKQKCGSGLSSVITNSIVSLAQDLTLKAIENSRRLSYIKDIGAIAF